MPIYKVDGKKDGLQKYRVRINYKDSSGSSKQLTRIAYGKEEAKRLEAKLLKEISQDNSLDFSFKEAVKKYLAYKLQTVRASSYHTISIILDRYALPHLKNYKLKDINTTVMREWKEQIAHDVEKVVYQKYIFTVLSAFFNWCVRMEYIDSNPAQKVGNFKDPYAKPQKEKLHYYTAEQFLKFKNVALQDAQKTKFYGYYVFFCIAFYTGMRKGEINALKWDDIENDIIHVKRGMSRTKGGLIEAPPKTQSSYRSLQMPETLVSILNEWKAIQQKDPLFNGQYYVCGGSKCISYDVIKKRNKKYQEAAGLPHINVHDFRHSHASLLANNGINIQEIARRLGHSKVETTWNIYSHLYPKEEERAVEILNQVK